MGFAAPARAYERSTVDSDPSRALFWRYRTVLVHPRDGSSQELEGARVTAALARSMATWNQAAEGCPSDFFFVDAGPAASEETNLSGGPHDGENRVVWRETWWPQDVDPATLALTTSVYRRSTGQLLDADIDVNGVHHTWTDADVPQPGLADAENTLTHELGHMLGLAHVTDPEATMFARSDSGEVNKRSLEADDIDGLCFIYPEGARTPGAPADEPMALMGGCAVRDATRDRPALWGLALGLAALVTRLRRRRAALR